MRSVHALVAAALVSAASAGCADEAVPLPAAAGANVPKSFFTDAAQRPQAQLGLGARTGSFAEVVGGLGEAEAVFEARRCLSCGNCFECDGCLGACPEDAVIKLGPGSRYRFDYDRCTGCAVCFQQCPCHAIEMIPETGGAT